MTLDKAMRLLGYLARSDILCMIPVYRDAASLGIEALKRLQTAEGRIKNSLGLPLPGETGDTQDPQPTPSAAPHEPLTWRRAWAEELALLNK